MNPKIKLLLIAFILVGCCAILFLITSLIIFTGDNTKSVNSFDDCTKLNGGIVLQTFPLQCTYNGKTYTKN